MGELLEFLDQNRGPWAVGFATQSQESEEYTAGSFHVICNEYSLNQESDCISFYQGEEGRVSAEVIIPLMALELMSVEPDIIVFADMNLKVAVENFDPNVFVYIQAIS